MTKVSRREAMLALLGGVGCLAGCSLTGQKVPTLPEGCIWIRVPYVWACPPLEGPPVIGNGTTVEKSKVVIPAKLDASRGDLVDPSDDR